MKDMARPIKQGLDYFPMDVDLDEKFELIEAKHGLIGFGVVIKLLQKIYKSGYFLEWNEERLLIFKKSINVNLDIIEAVLEDCFKYNLFNAKMYDQCSILTSTGIQKRYIQASERRKVVDLHRKYVIVDINSINGRINWIDEDINPTKESKEKESKGEEIAVAPPSPVEPDTTPEPQPIELKPTEPVLPEKKKRVQPDALQFPFSSIDFAEKWATLAAMPKWKRKPASALQLALNQIGRYSEDFGIKLIENAIAGNYQGVVFADTDEVYQRWLKNKQSNIGKIKISSPIKECKEWD